MDLTRWRQCWIELRFGYLYAESAVILLAARLWQSFWLFICLIALFIGLAATGWLTGLAQLWHLLILAAFLATAVWAFIKGAATFHFPHRAAVEQAMEQAAGIPHRPLQALRDRISVDTPATRHLWQEHQQRMRAARAQVRRARFHTTVAEQDRFYLRYATLLLVMSALIFSGQEAPPRLVAAVQPGWPILVARPAKPALDIWIAAPDYTQVAPVYLARAQNTSAALSASATVPAGSVLKIRLSGQHRAPLIRLGRERLEATSLGNQNFTAETVLQGSTALVLRQGLKSLGRWDIAVVPDTPPKVNVVNTAAAGNGLLKITWQAGDDYGVTKVVAVITAPDDLRGGLLHGGDALAVLDLPAPPPPAAGKSQDGVYSYQADLSRHPLAGHAVALNITVTDALGQTAKSASVEVVLPERKFESAVARRLIMERKRLLFYGDTPFAAPLVSDTLLDIVNQPELYRGDRVVFLTLASAARRIAYDGDAESLRSVADMLWDIALRIEDGGVSEAARELQDALAALNAALNDPTAPKEAIQELLGDVQDRLRDYMQAMAAEMQQRQQEGGTKPMPAEIADKVMQKIDIQDLMQQLQQMANGDQRDSLRQITEMLRNMMNNMSPESMARMQQAQQQAMEALQELQAVVQDQQRLTEATQSGGDADAPTPSPGDMREMAKAQEGLAARLEALRGKLGSLAAPMSENLDSAGQEMANAGEALRQGQADSAAIAQRAALKALTEAQDQAMQQLADAMKNMMMLGMGGGRQPGGSGEGFDPLGRSQDGGKNVGGEIGIPSEGERRRVQDIQRELRERYNDSDRPRSERDYLERLLDLFR